MNEREYIRLAKRAHQKYKKSLDALKIVWGMDNDSAPPLLDFEEPPKESEAPPKEEPPKGDTLAASVEKAIKSVPREFNIYDVEKELKKIDPGSAPNKSSLTHTLKRLAEDKKAISVVVVGRGKRPTTYARNDVSVISSTSESAGGLAATVRQVEAGSAN